MSGRRSNGEATFRQRSNGRWEVRLRYADPVTGAPVRTSLYGRTRAEARAKLREAQERLEGGQPVRDAKATVAQWAAEWSQVSLEASNRRESTKALSRTLLVKHVVPTALGAIPLERLRPSHFDAWVLELRARTRTVMRNGRAVEERALADSSIQRVFQVLSVCLDDAVRDGHLAKNPARLVTAPSARRPEARYLTADEVAAVLTAAQDTRYGMLFQLIAATGMRKGEALGLRWQDVDLDAGALAVRHTLSRIGGKLVLGDVKTKSSRRILRPAPQVIELLRAHRRRQHRERVRAANLWVDEDYVFTTEFGQPLDPRNVLRAFTTAAAKADVKGATVHTLRHSAATVLLEHGHSMKAISSILGHSGVQITGDIYAHVTPTLEQSAMHSLGSVLPLSKAQGE